MKLEGIHHVTAITADAQPNIDFYAGVLGLRLVKKSVNQDRPNVYHLFYGDEHGGAGSDITFFEFRGVPQGGAGAGMVHRIDWRLGDREAIGFWAQRLQRHGIEVELDGREAALEFADPEGLRHRFVLSDSPDPALIAEHPEVPAALALRGFDAVRAFAAEPAAPAALLEALGFETAAGGLDWEARGDLRGGRIGYDSPPEASALQGAGTVHHVAWASTIDDHEAWRAVAAAAGATPTPVIDRHYFRSIYFREPSGVLFEIATLGPGFEIDEPLAELGSRLSIPPFLEHRRAEIEAAIHPVTNPRYG